MRSALLLAFVALLAPGGEGTLDLSPFPDDIAWSRDGAPVPDGTPLPPGDHVLLAERPEHDPAEARVHVRVGEPAWPLLARMRPSTDALVDGVVDDDRPRAERDRAAARLIERAGEIGRRLPELVEAWIDAEPAAVDPLGDLLVRIGRPVCRPLRKWIAFGMPRAPDLVLRLGPAAAPLVPEYVRLARGGQVTVEWDGPDGPVPQRVGASNWDRRNAAELLGRLGSPTADAAVPTLRGLLADEDPAVELAAAAALARLGHAEEIRARLLERAAALAPWDDEAPDLAAALAALGPAARPAVAFLVLLLEADLRGVAGSADEALEALRAIGPGARTARATLMAGGLHRADGWTGHDRAGCLATLLHLLPAGEPDREAEAFILEALRLDPGPEVPAAITAGLAKRPDLVRRRSTELVALLGGNERPAPAVRLAIARLLGPALAESPGALAAVVAMSVPDRPDPARRALLRSLPPASARALLAAIAVAPGERDGPAADRLVEFAAGGAPGLADDLLRCVAHRDARFRRTTARALAALTTPDPEVRDALRTLAADTDPAVVAAALLGLRPGDEDEDREDRRLVAKGLKHTASVAVRTAAACSLLGVAPRSANGRTIAAAGLEAPDPAVRALAARALGRSGDAGLVERVLALPDRALHLAVIAGLRESPDRDPATLPLILRLVHGPDEPLSTAATPLFD